MLATCPELRPNAASRWLFVVLALAVLAALAGACSSDESTTAGALASGCIINTDCNSPLVCAFRKCHTACVTSRDCSPGERCVESDNPFHVCQLPDEVNCTYNSDCPDRQVCAVDRQCRDQCMTDVDCVKEQVCAGGACAEPTELRGGKLPAVAAEGGADAVSGEPCLYNSDCTSPFVCRSHSCTFECLAASDCPANFDCVTNRCFSKSATLIGAEGGSVTSASGAITLTVPAGALTEPAAIAIRPLEAYPSGALGPVFEISPTGLMFAKPATIAYVYRDADLMGVAPSELRLAQAVGPAWTPLPATAVDAASQTLSASTPHLSVYGCIGPSRPADAGANDASAGGSGGTGGSGGAPLEAGTPDVSSDVSSGGTGGSGNIPDATTLDVVTETATDATSDIPDATTQDAVSETANDATSDIPAAGPPLLLTEMMAVGGSHTCAVVQTATETNAMRCWGANSSGQLGYGDTTPRGDSVNDPLGGDIFLADLIDTLAAGDAHTCALLYSSSSVYCWGDGTYGQTGLDTTQTVGDDELPRSFGSVDLSDEAVNSVAAGAQHTCAVVASNNLYCWGRGTNGQLGYANTNNIGDNELIRNYVNVGDAVRQVALGRAHTCALTFNNNVRCWGDGTFGQLGYGNTNTIGDDEEPATVGDVPLGGGTVIQIAAGSDHTCALFDTETVRCWGHNNSGQLGYANTNNIGDDETAAAVADVNVGGNVVEIAAGGDHTCARLDTGAVRCWGDGTSGALGYGNANSIGIVDTPASAGDVPLGGNAQHIAAGKSNTCAILDTGTMRCWGLGLYGALGYGSTQNVGDSETPAQAGDVPIY